MADPRHLAKLKEGVQNWNLWRSKHPEVAPDLTEGNLAGRDLRGADLSGTDLSRASLSGVNLCGANLTGASLRETHLGTGSGGIERPEISRTESAELRLHSTRIGFTTFGDNDLSTVKGLDTLEHAGPSTIGIDTIFRSKGNISEAFLRRAGVPESFIAYMRSLTAGVPNEFISYMRSLTDGTPSDSTTDVKVLTTASAYDDYYSCFISYSSRDEAFAQKLHSELLSRKIRCWKDSEDLKIGDRLQDEIETAITQCDKLLLVLSEDSINSAWVEWEVRKAFKKEQEQGCAVLFPVRLDDYVKEVPYDWAGEVRKRNIGDFRTWKDHDSFQKSLDRLLRDLKSQDSEPK
ncbi:MAG TPA: TIR domain-containing protein [Candidatus Acidoferrum sp.]|nr:TIR domain-containing protein [Candidatus Acidoferrum sp.]